MTPEALAALQRIYPSARAIVGGIEIEAEHVSVYDIGDCLRSFGVGIRGTATRQVSLDDVFVELTGKEIRE